ncbi:Putative oxidoreductase YdbC [Listeria grayi]|uniref:Oxidoreductase YdbC n=1 Tax=Listeria grayi TaxID=1641 RepID=A0A378MHR6_LISGR|nr:aldo/keto reductase [Listeria grayi]STY44932.1 Putative oxidoreductase YdbC [Listeria grayi]
MTKKTFTFSDGLEVNRLGYGTMQLTGEGVFGPYKDPEKAVDVLKAVLESEINFIDTADAYGPFYANLYVKKH